MVSWLVQLDSVVPSLKAKGQSISEYPTRCVISGIGDAKGLARVGLPADRRGAFPPVDFLAVFFARLGPAPGLPPNEARPPP